MILFFRVDIPHIFLPALLGQDIVHRLKGSCHGVIHVIIAVLSVPSHTVKVLILVQIRNHLVNLTVCVKIRRICLLHFFPVRIQHIFFAVDHTHLNQFFRRQTDALVIRQIPEGIILIAEIFQTFLLYKNPSQLDS